MLLTNNFYRALMPAVLCGVFISSSIFSAPFQPPQTAREKLNFDLNWKFIKNDQAGAQSPTYNDASWTTVHLPHSFQQVSVAGDNVDRGMGWYRKHFTLTSAYQNKVLTLYFEGAMAVSRVFINGTELATNYGGFHPFCYDITQYCHTDGSDNVIALRLNNASDNLVPPQNPVTGIDYELYGGLNKDVYLIATDRLYVPEAIHSWNSGWADQGGHFITYSNVTSTSATVQVQTWVKNVTGAAVSGSLSTYIVDAATNEQLTSSSATLTSASNAVTRVSQNINVSGITRWAPWSPKLYWVYTVVYNGTTPVDMYATRIGIRSITYNVSSGMQVNGTPFKVLGLNRTNQWVFLGHACPNNQQKRDAVTLREWGCNFVRCSHYPMDDAFYDGCDSAGLLLFVEVPSWHCCSTQPTTNSTWVGRMHNELRFMVRNGRNRACIAIWGAGLNEAAKSSAYETPMNTMCLTEDPTRPTSAARQAGTESSGNIFTFYGQNEFCAGDLPGSNPDPNTVGFMNTEHTGHMFHNHSNRELHSEQQLLDHATMHALMTTDGRNRNWCAGSLGWCAFDYYTHWNTSFHWRAVHGVFDVMHIPKPAAYFYRSQSAGDNYDGSIHPYIKIANFYAANSPVDRRVYSNCQQVRLYRGTTLIGTQNPDNTPYYVNYVGRPASSWNLAHPPFTFRNVTYQAGSMLRAEGLISNVVVARDTVRAQGSPSTIKLVADPPVIDANAQDISRIEAYIVDANGTWIHSATNSVTWTLNGSAATLVGDNPISAQAGACVILAKATLNCGTVTVRASASGSAFEAEAAALSGGAGVATDHTGYTGTGFVDGFINSTTAQVLFTVTAPSAGQYSVQLRYSAGNGASSNTGLFVNGVQTATLSCPATASWDTWSTVTNTVTLNAGSNTIAYRAVTSANACINLDNITIPSIGGITPQTIDITVNCGTTEIAPAPPAANHAVSLSPSVWYARVIGNRIVLPAATPLPASITLYNLAGTQIYRGVVTGRRVKISRERKLPEGIYIVKAGR